MVTINKALDFNSAAVGWDQEPRRVKLANDVGKAIANAVRLNSSMDVLDFGCGTGLLTLCLQPAVCSITGVDSSWGMIEVLNSKIKSKDLNNVKTKCLDLAQGDVLNDQYSLVVSSMTFHHIKDVKLLIEYFYKILIPGGHLCIADLDSDGGRFHDSNDGVFHSGFERSEIRGLFSKAGFADIKDWTAATVWKTDRDGENREFSVFLIAGCKEKKIAEK